MRHSRRGPKIAALAVATALTAFTAMSAGGFSLFSSSTSAGQSLSSGTINVSLGASGTAAGDYLTYNTTPFGPSDTVSMGATVTNTGTLPAIVSVALGAIPSTPLTTDPTNGLVVTIYGCSTPFTATSSTPTNGSAGQYTYSCPGSLTATAASDVPVASVLNTPVTIPLSSATDGSLAAGASAGVEVTYSLPGVASQSAVQGQSIFLGYTFNETQTAGAPQ